VKGSNNTLFFVLLSLVLFTGNRGFALEDNPAEKRENSASGYDLRMELTLEDCVLKAWTNNITLKKNRRSLDSISTYIDEAKGKFDPEFFATVTGSENVRPMYSYTPAPNNTVYTTLMDVESDRLNVSTGFRGTLLTGATYTLKYDTTRSFDVYMGEYNKPEFNSNFGIELRQPMLKGGWTTYARSEFLKAKISARAEAFSMKSSLSDVVFSVIEAYWDLKFTIEDLEAKETSLKLAEELLSINIRKKEEGVFSKMEVLEARAEVAMKQEQLITARSAVRAAEDTLKHLIFSFDEYGEWDVNLVPLTKAEDVSEIDFDVEMMIASALDNRPEYNLLEQDLKNREIDLLTARNDLLPMLDMTGSWSYNALGSNFGNTFDEIEHRQFRSFSIGMDFSYPLGNRSAQASHRRAKIEYRKAYTAMKELEIQIVHDIRNAIREVGLQREKLNASRESWHLAKERYEGEKKRLEAGLSIPFQVREAERNLLTETVTKARSLLDYQIALAQVAKAKGVLLDQYSAGWAGWSTKGEEVLSDDHASL